MARWESIAVRALGSVETELTVLGREQVGPQYLRLHLGDGGLLAQRPPFPTMWVRLWFARDGRDHQRAYTLVDPDPQAGTFSLEFALHDGAACQWARTCEPGDRIRASLLGSKPPWGAGALDAARPATGRTILIGDSAALPAINSLLDALGEAPDVEVWLEHHDPRDAQLPVRTAADHHLRRIEHRAEENVASALAAHWQQASPTAGDRVWIALEAAATRKLTRSLRTDHGLPKDAICAQAYWRS